MEKNEILEKSRVENKGKDIAELEIRYKAQSIAYSIGFAVSALLYAIDSLFLDTGFIGSAALTVYISLAAASLLARGILGKNKKHKIWGIVAAIVAVLCFIGTVL